MLTLVLPLIEIHHFCLSCTDLHTIMLDLPHVHHATNSWWLLSPSLHHILWTTWWLPLFVTYLQTCFLSIVQVPDLFPIPPVNSHALQYCHQLVPVDTIKSLFKVNIANINILWCSKFLPYITQIAGVAYLVPLPFLKPYWSFSRSISTLLSNLRVRIFSTIFEACETRIIVLKPAHSCAPLFSIGIIKYSINSFCQAPFSYIWLHIAKKIRVSLLVLTTLTILLPVCKDRFQLSQHNTFFIAYSHVLSFPS